MIPQYFSRTVTKSEMNAKFKKLNADHVFKIVWHWIHWRFVSPSTSSITRKREIKAIRRRAVLNLLGYKWIRVTERKKGRKGGKEEERERGRNRGRERVDERKKDRERKRENAM